MQPSTDDRRLLRVFAAFQRLRPDARDPALARLRRSRPALADRLHSLILHAERPATILRAPLAVSAGGAPPDTWTPPRIGRYRVTGRLGEGGTSIVFEAEQESPRRRVAVKVLRAVLFGDAGARRLAVEGAALAALDHPGIVRVLEAGVDESTCPPLPYLVMELVRGEPLPAYAAANSLGTARRVGLIAEICDAVDYAHSRGVIHRDLKPDNVLVDAAGRPRLLDFGLARLLAAGDEHSPSRTAHGEILGTPAYMSPEQASGERVDHRTDIYSLGMMLVELLTGRPPQDLSGLTLTTAIRVVRGRAAVSLPRGLSADLATIVRTATAADPGDRYATASDLAEDLRRWLRRECIAARRLPVARRIARGAWRRRGPLARTTAAAAMVVLAAGLSVRSARAEVQGRLATMVSSFLTGHAAGTSDLPFEARLRRFGSHADSVCGRHADLKLVSLRDLAKGLSRMGHADDAEAAYRHAVAYATGAFSPQHAEALTCRMGLASVLLARGRAEEAFSICESVLVANHHRRPLPAVRLLQLHACMSDCLQALGRTTEARRELERATSMAQALPPRKDAMAVRVLAMLVEKNLERGSQRGAAACAHRLVDIAPGSRALDVLDAMASATAACAASGDVATAEVIARAASTHAARMGVPRIDFDVFLAGELWLRGRRAEAEALLETTISWARSSADIDELHLANALNSYGVCLRDRGDCQGARRALLESLEIRQRALGETHPRVVDCRANLVKVCLLEGDFAAARRLAEIVLFQRQHGDDPDALCEAIGLTAAALAATGDLAAALDLLDEARAARRESLAGSSWRGDYTIDTFAGLLARAGRVEEARRLVAENAAAAAFMSGSE